MALKAVHSWAKLNTNTQVYELHFINFSQCMQHFYNHSFVGGKQIKCQNDRTFHKRLHNGTVLSQLNGQLKTVTLYIVYSPLDWQDSHPQRAHQGAMHCLALGKRGWQRLWQGRGPNATMILVKASFCPKAPTLHFPSPAGGTDCIGVCERLETLGARGIKTATPWPPFEQELASPFSRQLSLKPITA